MAKKTVSKETEATRQAILAAARNLFFELGYRAVTTRQVAEACGLTQPALYHHFANKQDLYVAMIVQELQRLRGMLERIVRRNDSLEERLRLLVPCLQGNKNQDMSIMFHDLNTELNPDNRALVEQEFSKCMIRPITSVFEDGLEQGLLRTPEEGGVPAELAAWIFMNSVSTFFGENHENFARFIGRNDGDIARLIVRLHLQGIAKSPPLA